MTGPEHYREAEQLVRASSDSDYDQGKGRYSRADLLAEAQVHATLALAAATVAERGLGPEESSGWRSFEIADGNWQGTR